jgi:FkbM family methyltransferase
MAANSIVAALPPDFFLTVIDVGSAGGLHRRWRPYRDVISAILFDPREKEAGGHLGRGGTRVYPVALGRTEGEATLHLTALPNMSSFLEPDRMTLGRYHNKGRDSEVVETAPVPVQRLDTLAAAEGFTADVIKVDTQGSEGQVLEGAQSSLSSTILAEVEVSFLTRYLGQPLFADIEAQMRRHGFELIDLYRLKRYHAENPLSVRKGGRGPFERTGRVAYADAIFLRREEDILARAAQDEGATLLRALTSLLPYGKVDIAARLFGLARGTLPSALAARLEPALTAAGRTPLSLALIAARLGRRR